MPLRDDDISTDCTDELYALAFVVIANAARDLGDHMREHNMPDCVIQDTLAIADTAEAAAAQRLTPQHIENFRWFLTQRAAFGGHD